MVELRRRGYNERPGRTFIVHLDDETLITEDQLLVLADYLTGRPRPISAGPIYYPLQWAEAPWLCRALESIRPFGCSECARVMRHPPPSHLHGSNLVVDEQVENRLGWDIGTLDGQAFVAEDLVFGLRAYALLGKAAFGWHGATMLEQPPFSLYWAFRQRQRWVLGALQGVRALSRHPDYARIPARERRRIAAAIRYRVATYALGFPVGLVGLLFLLRHLLLGSGLPGPFHGPGAWPAGIWAPPLLVSGLGWVLSYQIGLARNLRAQALSWPRRLGQHLAILALTPLAGLIETIGPFTAAAKWSLGLRRVSWTPTLKVADQGGAGPSSGHPAGSSIRTAPARPLW
jgi:hypothetical protein